MEKHETSAAVQEQGCRALLYLPSSDENKVTIRRAGGIRAVVAAVWKHGRQRTSRAVVTIVREGGIKAVITGMQKHADSEKVQLGGIGALWNLACKFENKVTVAREEGIGAVIT
eukprot:1308736-Rhodomonas_salina.1